MKRIFCRIVLALIVVWSAFFLTDFSLAKANRRPIFAIAVILFKDGGSAEYYGIGYKVNVYVKMIPEGVPKIVKVDIGSWFMPDLYEK